MMKIKNVSLGLLFSMVLVFPVLITCEKPFEKEAFFVVENSSTLYAITGVYYAHTGFGSNRISSNIQPGSSRTFTLSAEGDYIYNIQVTSNHPSLSTYSNDGIHFYEDRRITINLTDNEWEESYPW
ncbi:MAG: hypothetical protein V2I54_06790 [Bacteroidales bacterium]|jgi:hypothetical protein|nr:hypothetical protein [Bacteroidales bacterium]